MKKITILLCLATLILSSCNHGNNEITHYPFKASRSDKWGLVDVNGKILVEDMFKVEPTPVVNGIFFVGDHDGVQMFSIDKPEKPIGDTYKGILPFVEDVTPSVKKGECFKYINKEGEVKFELKDTYTLALNFMNGYSLIGNGDYNFDAISTDGNIVSFSEYSIMTVLDENLFLVTERNDPKQVYIVNKDGEIKYTITDSQYMLEFYLHKPWEYNYYFSPDLKYYVYQDPQLTNDWGGGGYGLRSIDGDIVLNAKENRSLKFDIFGNLLSQDYFESKTEYQEMDIDAVEAPAPAPDNDDNTMFGVLDINGHEIINIKGSVFMSMDEDLFVARKNDKFGLINKKGDVLIPFNYDYMFPLSNTTVIARENYKGKYIMLDKNGKKLGEYVEFDGYDGLYYLYGVHGNILTRDGGL